MIIRSDAEIERVAEAYLSGPRHSTFAQFIKYVELGFIRLVPNTTHREEKGGPIARLRARLRAWRRG